MFQFDQAWGGQNIRVVRASEGMRRARRSSEAWTGKISSGGEKKGRRAEASVQPAHAKGTSSWHCAGYRLLEVLAVMQ